MKNKILILTFMFLALFIWSCDEEPPLAPETSNDQEVLKKATIGETTTILSAEYGTWLEGVAFDRMGNMYISRTKNQVTDIFILKENGSYEVFATFPGFGKAVGLAVDKTNKVYFAYHSDDKNVNGVYRIKRNGKFNRLTGSEEIDYPDGLVFDTRGNLYVSDYGGGSIWKYQKGKRFEKWIEHDFLKPYTFDPFPMTLEGANGLAFYPPNILYVANTEKSNIVKIEIMLDGNAGIPTQITPEVIYGGIIVTIDGIAVSESGNIYAISPACTPTGGPPLWKIDPADGSYEPILVDGTQFDFPTSIAFGTRGLEKRATLYVVNSDLLPDPTMGSGPGVVKVFVGEFGLPIK